MLNSLSLNTNYSTTRLVTKEKTTIINRQKDKFETVLFLDDTKEKGGLRTQGYFKKSYDTKPLVSIITVVFNGEKFLEKTIQSVINQLYTNIEYIIIDGGSTDKTLTIIKQYENQIDYWISEKDNGIYDAMNKGLSLASGDIIGIINADDWYELNSVEKSIAALLKNDADYTIGNCRKIPSNIVAKPIYPLIPGKLYQEMMYPHISAFIKTKIYKKVGGFDTNYKIVADYEMATRINNQNYQPVYVEQIIATIVEGGVSGNTKAIKERLKVVLAYDKNYILSYLRFLSDIFKFYIKKIIPKNIVKIYQRLKKSRFQYE